ncbi:MAG: hypothetical protein M1827_005156 [Pycnora praestabilis]|nr:MAG: hypothetical protein M1827_005156 [Pycnora praestabilis]
MFGPLFAAFTLFCLISYVIIYPIVGYFRDPKGLRRYPSLSIFSGFTDFAFLWESHKGFRSHALLDAHKKSPVVRIGPNSLSYGSVDAIKDIYGHNTKCVKDVFYERLSGTHFHLADVVDKPEHARKRKVLSSAYALKNLEGWEYKVADKTERLIRGFDARATAPLTKEQKRPDPQDLTVDYRSWTNFFTLDAIADIGLSERLGFLDAGSDKVTSESMDGTLKEVNYRECLHATARAQSGIVWAYDWYKFLIKFTGLVSPWYRRMWKLNKDWDGIVLHRATQRLKRYQAGEKLDDFFSALMDDKNGNPNNLPWGEIVAEISIMMNAGSDTTAIAMNNAMYFLLKNPLVLSKLREEVDSVLEDTEVVAPYDKVKHLPYLRACLDESMRMYPPSTFGLPRRTPPEGAPILGDFVAGDTSVSISAYVAHRDESAFPEPLVYRPERWLEEGAKEMQPYFITFSAGARGCIGRNISYLEQTVLLASVVHRYEFALPYDSWEPERWESFNLSPGPMPIKIWRRELGVEKE